MKSFVRRINWFTLSSSATVASLSLLACSADAGSSSDSQVGAGQFAVTPACGNGVRDTLEECDDGNATNLDGCSSSCRFEQAHRADSLLVQFGTDSFCPANALGGSVSSLAQGTFQDTVNQNVGAGIISVLFTFAGLTDLTGSNNPKFTLGSVVGMPFDAAATHVNSEVDGWYKANPLSLDANRTPLALIEGSITAGKLSAGPGRVGISFDLGGGPATLEMANVRVQADVSDVNQPLVSSGSAPGHLASENLDPSITSFTKMTEGSLCGATTTASFSKLNVPAQLTAGDLACAEGYSVSNTMLDVLVGGCTVFFFEAITKTQPDQVDASAAVAGAGGPYRLSAGSDHKVNSCQDKDGNAVDFQACLSAAAYSNFFKFTSNRIVIRN